MEFTMDCKYRIAALVPFVVALVTPTGPTAQSSAAAGGVTFTKDIAPILQRSCQRCHNGNGVAPMPLTTYEEVRPWARAIKTRTGLGPNRGVMPPWFVEKDLGIQKFKDDPSLSDEEIANIAKWVDSGAPRGNPAEMPPPINWESTVKWVLGEPDLILRSKEITVPASAPDWWGDVGIVPTGLTEDRYASSVEVHEVNDIPKGATNTVGGRYVWHHMTYSTIVQGGDGNATAPEEASTGWPIHEVGRNPDVFPPESGRLLAANSALALTAAHVHANGRETKAHLEFGFRFFPKGYKPLYKRSSLRLGNGIDIDIKPNKADQQLHSYTTLTEHTKVITFEPHMHAPGMRMCLEAIWGHNVQTLNCVGYDHIRPQLGEAVRV
jgi:mono/diheme cytochrome c family protein